MTYMNGGSICTWGVVNRDPEFGGKNMNCLVNKTQQTTFHGDNKINTADRISFSSKIARNWLAPWRVHLLDELLVLIVAIPRRAGRRRGWVPICECCHNMKNTRSELQSNYNWRPEIQETYGRPHPHDDCGTVQEKEKFPKPGVKFMNSVWRVRCLMRTIKQLHSLNQ